CAQFLAVCKTSPTSTAWVPWHCTSPKPPAADTLRTPSPTTSATTSLKWAESPSTSATTPKTLSCREIPTKQPNSPTKTTPWTNYTVTYSPSSWTANGPTPSPPQSTSHC